jgi:class 3 adenylate cyclase
MALFPKDADSALQGAIAMLQALTHYNFGRKKANYNDIRVGIGINTGRLMLGTIGGENRMDSTVVADAVNLASRVEGLTKIYGTSLLITEQTHLKLVRPGQYHIRVIDAVAVKGKSELVTVYEVFDADPPKSA